MQLIRLSSIAALATAALLVGCAATVSRDTANASTIAASPAAARKIVLEITGSDQMTKSADWEAFKEEWQTSMSAAAGAKQSTFTLGSASTAGAEPTVVVKLRVNDFKYVSQAKRYGVGIFAGNAYMDVDAQFVEYPGEKVLGTRKYQTSSSAWQGVFSAMTPKQVEAVSKEIVNAVRGNSFESGAA